MDKKNYTIRYVDHTTGKMQQAIHQEYTIKGVRSLCESLGLHVIAVLGRA